LPRWTTKKRKEKQIAEAPIVELTDSDFPAAARKGVVLIDFWAPWCGPCRMQTPIVEEVARELAGRATVAKINIDENIQTAARFGIRSIPTLVVLRDGTEVERFVGVQPRETLLAALERHLPGEEPNSET